MLNNDDVGWMYEIYPFNTSQTAKKQFPFGFLCDVQHCNDKIYSFPP